MLYGWIVGCVEGIPTEERVLEDDPPVEVAEPWDGDGDAPGDTGEAGEPTPDDAFLFGPDTLDLELELSDEAIAGLADDADEDLPDVEATFRWGAESQIVGVRLRGGHGSFRTFDDKPSFEIDFDEFVDGQRFHGLSRLSLKNMVQDESMLGEHAAFGLFAARGVPAPRHGYARVHVNGEWFGLYGVIEALHTTEFLERAFGERGGTLWEGKMDDLVADGIDGYEVAVQGGLLDSSAPLREFVAALDAAGPAGLLGVLEEKAVADSFLELMAVELVSGNPDGYVAWTNNYYLHLGHSTGRFTMVAWGPDLAFTAALPVTSAYLGRLYEDCRRDAACGAELRAHIGAVADTLDAEPWTTWIRAEAARTEADCLADPRSPGGAAECAAAREELFTFLDGRADQVRDELATFSPASR